MLASAPSGGLVLFLTSKDILSAKCELSWEVNDEIERVVVLGAAASTETACSK